MLPSERFGSHEHQSLGDAATGGASYDVGGPGAPLLLSHGDLIALSGDYFLAGPGTRSAGGRGDPDDLFVLAARPGDRGQTPGTRDEVLWALAQVRAGDPRFAADGAWGGYVFSDAVRAQVDERFQRLAAANATHFVAPRGRDASGQPNPSPEGSAGSAYRSTHEAALRLAFDAGQGGAPIDRAMAMEACAQHYLTDAFAAGHLRTPVASIRAYWGEKHPLFWYNLRHKIALDTAVRLNDQSTNLTTIVGTVDQMYRTLVARIESIAQGLPAVTLGDVLAKVFHDHDNLHGLDIVGGGRVYGDDHLDQADPRNRTRALALEAIRDGIVDVQTAYALGEASAGQVLGDDALFAQLRAQTGAGDRYLAETRVPVPAASEPPQNWMASSLSELWDLPVTGTSGPTVGARLADALQPGHDIHLTLDDLAAQFPEVDAHWSGDLRPRQAYRDGFLAPLAADPRAGLLHILDWAPNYGLASIQRDDEALASGQELDRDHQLAGMTTSARLAYLHELLGGITTSAEGALVVRIFETAAASERRGMYRQIEGHDWTGDFRRGVFVADDRLWNALTGAQRSQLRGLLGS